MKKAVTDIIDDVRRLIDEIGLNESEDVLGADDAELRSIIRANIVPAAKYVTGNADWSLLEADVTKNNEPVSGEGGNIQPLPVEPISGESETSNDEATLHTEANGIKWWEIRPFYFNSKAEFFRLVEATLSDWHYAQKDIIWNTDKEYAMLKNPYTTGTPERPKVAARKVLQGTEWDVVLELYSTRVANGGTWSVSYCAVPEISTRSVTSGGVTTSIEEINISRKLVEALEYYTAGLTLATFKDSHADAMFNMALTNMGLKTEEQ